MGKTIMPRSSPQKPPPIPVASPILMSIMFLAQRCLEISPFHQRRMLLVTPEAKKIPTYTTAVILLANPLAAWQRVRSHYTIQVIEFYVNWIAVY